MLTENVPVARNRSVWRTTFRGDLQPIHLPGVDLPAVVAPENVAARAIIEVDADLLDMVVANSCTMHDASVVFLQAAVQIVVVAKIAGLAHCRIITTII